MEQIIFKVNPLIFKINKVSMKKGQNLTIGKIITNKMKIQISHQKMYLNEVSMKEEPNQTTEA
jgi:hypothetical protein